MCVVLWEKGSGIYICGGVTMLLLRLPPALDPTSLLRLKAALWVISRAVMGPFMGGGVSNVACRFFKK